MSPASLRERYQAELRDLYGDEAPLDKAAQTIPSALVNRTTLEPLDMSRQATRLLKASTPDLATAGVP